MAKARKFTLSRMPFPMEMGPNAAWIKCGDGQLHAGEDLEVVELAAVEETYARAVSDVVEELRSDPPPFASREWCKQAAVHIEARFGAAEQ